LERLLIRLFNRPAYTDDETASCHNQGNEYQTPQKDAVGLCHVISPYTFSND
jgi:hypothetical protein